MSGESRTAAPFGSAFLIQVLTVRVNNGESYGSGVILGAKEGIVATCSHVVRDFGKGGIETPYHDRPIPYEVLWKGYEGEEDIAILRADFPSIGFDKFVSGFVGSMKIRTEEIPSAEPVMICGYPSVLRQDQLMPVLTAGIVSTFPDTTDSSIVVSATLYPGNSGGPCFDSKNRLIGLASAMQPLGTAEVLTQEGRQFRPIPANYGFVVPIRLVVEVVGKLNVLPNLASLLEAVTP